MELGRKNIYKYDQEHVSFIHPNIVFCGIKSVKANQDLKVKSAM